MKYRFKRILAMVLSICLLAGMMSLPTTAYAEGPAEIQAAGLPGIKSGHDHTADNTTIVGFGGKEWYVIGYDGHGVASDSGTMTLLLKTPHDSGGYGKEYFNPGSWYGNNYNSSLLKDATDNAYNQLPENEKELVLLRSSVSSDAGFWPLSTGEAQQVSLGEGWRSSVLQYSDKWWLRSPAGDGEAGMVYASGQLLFDEVYHFYAVRPAFNLNLNPVLFTSSANGAGAKASAALGGGLIGLASPSGKLKFTARESDTSRLSLTSATLDKTVVRAGGKLTVTFGGALTGPAKYVSCVLTDSSGTVNYYGKLSDQSSGQASFKVPALAGGNYKIKLFNEQVSGDNHTDFCSTPIEIDITVDDSPVLNPGANLSGTQVYLGTYYSTPIRWHLVAMDSDTLTLFTPTSMGYWSFDPEGKSWADSFICEWLNDTFLTDAFRVAEQNAIAVYGDTEEANPDYGLDYPVQINQKILLPSVQEMGNDIFTGTWNIDQNTRRSIDGHLRSDGPGGSASIIDSDGIVSSLSNDRGTPAQIRPTLKLKLDSILLISDAAGGKSTGVGGNLPELDTPSGAVKFTLPDTAQNLDLCATVAQSTQQAGTLQFSYKAATTGAGQYVSCVLADDATGEVLYYGKLADSSANANGNLSIPLAGVANGTYRLKVFSEKINNDFFTDYCSTPVGMTVNVTNGIGTVSDFSGTKLKIAAVPAANPGLKYSGGEQTGVNEGEGYTLSGHKATNVGSYTATARLEPGYDWEDGATGDKTINWSIAKADSPAAPTGLTGIKTTAFGGSDGKITGTSTAMEYADNAGFNNAQSCAASETTGLTTGIYYVRLKATDTHEASRHASVYVPSGNYPYNAIITVPDDINDNTPFDLEIKITDSAGNTLENYTGTVLFGVSIAATGVPESYAFTAADKGVKTFNMRLTESGSAKITVTGEDINPIAYWKFDGASTDSSGNGYTVTPHGAAFSEDKPALQFTNGKSLLLNGNNDYCDIPDDVTLGNKSFSISFWAKKSVWGAGYIVGSRLNGGNNNTLHVGYRDANNFTCAFFSNDLDAPAPNDGAWHHWTVTYDAETRNRVIYCDGEEAARDISASNFLSNAPLRIGTAFDNIGNFDGNVDDLRIYYLALPPGAAKGLYEGTEYPGFRGEKQVFVNPKAYSLSASAQHGSVSAGQANLVTLKVLSGSGEVDTSFTGSKNVTISGIGSAPNGEFGSYDGNTLGLATTLNLLFQSGEFAGELLLSKAGAHNLNFSVEGVHVPEASLSLTVTPGAAHKLILLQDIAAPLVNGGQFAVQPELAVTDHYGNIVTGDNSTQIIAYTSGQPGYDLSGTTTVTVQNGEAVFTDLGVTGYMNEIVGARLRFRESDNKLIEAESGAVTLPRDKTAKTLRITVAPGLKKVGIPFDATVEALDMSGERAESYRGNVTFTSSSGETFAYNFPFTESNKGSKTFSATINTEGAKTLTATDGSLTASVQVSIADADGRFLVSYDANGSGNAPPAHKAAAGQNFTAPQADGMTPPTGKLFKEWNTAADGSGTAYAPDTQILMPEQPLTLYAIWRDPTPDEKIAEALAALNWDTIKGGNSVENDVKTALNLIKTGAQDTTITWSASPEGIIDTGTGGVTKPNDTDKTVALTATVSKTGGTSQTKVFTLTVKRELVAPTITTATLSDGTVGTAYSQTLTATGTMPITWSITNGSLPDGLSLNAATGVISGTPAAAGTTSFTVKASNGAGDDSIALSIVISTAAVAPGITTTTLPNGTVGTAYSQTLAADGDTPITWSVDSGNLPDGLTLNGTTGVISGTPTTAGAFNFTIKAENSEGYDTKALAIVISPAAVTSAGITPDTGSFDRYSPGDVTTSITWNSATAVTGISDGTVSLASPAHYEVSGNILTAKKAYLKTRAVGNVVLTIAFDQGGPATLTISVTDSTPPSTSPVSINYDLSAPDDVTTTIIWNSASMVTGVVYGSTSLMLPIDYIITGSVLTINNSYLSGLTPSEGDTLVFDISFDTGDTAALTVHVVDSCMPSGDADLSDLTVGGNTVGGFDPADDEYNVELPYGTQPGSAAATVGATANDPLAQVGVTQASTLPGSATVTVTAEDGTQKIYTVIFTLGAAPGTAPTIITASLPGGTVGTFYSQTLAAAGDTPITWTIDSGDLPAGLSLSGNTISGTPTTAGTFGFTVKAENAEGSDTKALEIVIGSTPPAGTAPTIITTSLPDGRVGSSYSRPLAAAGDTPITWTIDGGSLPNGLTLNGSTGVISGAPTASGSFSFTVKATNAVGSVTKNLSITINAASTGDGSGDGSGGGSGGGSGDGSGGGTTVIIRPEKKPDQPVIAGFSATPAVNSSGHATLTVAQQSVSDAIAKAQADARAQGKTEGGIAISLNIDLPDTAKSLGIVLPQATLQSLVDAGVRQLEINGVIVSLDLDLEALKEIQKQSTGDVTITIKPTQNLSAAAKKLIGARPVYDVTVSYVRDGKTVNITSLSKGGAILSMPYTPGKNEAVGYLFGVFVNANGQATRISGSAYDVNNGSLILNTNHFSVYGIGYTAPAEKYTDIATHWAKESIDYVVGRGLFSGTTDTSFSPNTATDRGMLVTVLGRLAGVNVSQDAWSSSDETARPDAYKTGIFADVAAGYYLPYVEWAYKNGIVSGVGGGKFAPGRAATREEIALILQNYAKATGYTLPVTREAITFADASSIGGSYRAAVRAMQQAGIMMGGSGSKFNPKAGATRAEVAAMLHRYVKLTIDPATAQGWAKNDDGRYMYYKDGKPFTGWQIIDGKKYFFDTTGSMQTGWKKDDKGNWYYLSATGALVGWWDIGSDTYKKRYYFDTNAVMISGKWLRIEGKWYYFYADGSLARDTKIDGYEVDENGVRKTE